MGYLCFRLSLSNAHRFLHLLQKPHAIFLKQQMEVSLIMALFNLAENVKSSNNKGLTVLHASQLALAYYRKQLQAFSLSVHIQPSYLGMWDLNTQPWCTHTAEWSGLGTSSLENCVVYISILLSRMSFSFRWKRRYCFKFSEIPGTLGQNLDLLILCWSGRVRRVWVSSNPPGTGIRNDF